MRPTTSPRRQVAVVGAGWAGLSAAIEACAQGQQVTLIEAARTAGGRARSLDLFMPDGRAVRIDNGQHILIGAYRATLALMRRIGLDPDALLLRLPLTLRRPDGSGLSLPQLPAPLDVLVGIARAQGWPWRERVGLLAAAARWQLRRFECDPQLSVAELCRDLGPHILEELIDPLCVSALNTPSAQASAQVFLRVLRDALFDGTGGSNLLLPRTDLGAAFAEPALQWLHAHGVTVRTGTRAHQLRPCAQGWALDDQCFDAVVLATPAAEAARLVAQAAADAPTAQQALLRAWAQRSDDLAHEAIATVYAWSAGAKLPLPMLSLHSPGPQAPAQFVFDRGQLGGPDGLLAFVVSASAGTRDALTQQVLQQARDQLGVVLQPVQTIVEKRATFACTPGLQRPPAYIAPGLLACGDYIEGPYPATLEGAVRSGLDAAARLTPVQR